MKYSGILVVTYGRSGSTLLQGVLNSIDGCLVRGENYNFCYGLFQAYESLRKARAEFGKGPKSLEVTSPWFGASLLDEQRFLADARAILARQLDPEDTRPDCLGFKEIRYLGSDLTGPASDGLPKRNAYLNFLEMLLPDPAIIVLTRAHDDVAKSAWWQYKDSERVVRQLEAFETEIANWMKGRPNVFHITYEDMIGKTARLRAMFGFLGAPWNEDVLERVLGTRHSYQMKPARREKARSSAAESASRKARMENVVTVSDIDAALARHVELDASSSLESAKGRRRLSGIVLLAPHIDSPGIKLLLLDSRGEKAVEWRLPSSKFAARRKQDPNARAARFKVDDVRFPSHGNITMFMIDSSGHRHPLFCISSSEQSGKSPS